MNKKKKILLLSDDLRMHSGVAVMSHEIVKNTLHHYDWVQIVANAKLEPSLAGAPALKGYQFERTGYFCRDDHFEHLVFNQTVGLRDSWAKIEQQG